MTEPAASSAYRMLDRDSLIGLLGAMEEVAGRLEGDPRDWRVLEVGDGNLNLVFIVEGRSGSVCVKQALPYVRAAGPSWPMSLDRAYFENSYYRTVAPHVRKLIPQIYRYDPDQHFTVMERLSPHIILRHGLIAGRRYPNLARDVGEYVGLACFFTSDLAEAFESKMDRMALFAGNKPLIRISVDLIFAEPYRIAERNRHTSPQLDAVVADMRRDGALKAAVCGFGWKFLNEPQALIHGDLHSGSLMVTDTETRIIDPEFAFYGPIGFDLGAFFGNLLLSWYSQPGHATAADDRTGYQAWIAGQLIAFWAAFENQFLALWRGHATGDAYPANLFSGPGDSEPMEGVRRAFLDELFADMVGFAACKMIRRILGFAHVIDFESIQDAGARARCESAALSMARLMLTQPERFVRVEDVIEAMPRAASLARTGAG
jgi:5-methylthioribose kinase